MTGLFSSPEGSSMFGGGGSPRWAGESASGGWISERVDPETLTAPVTLTWDRIDIGQESPGSVQCE
ncbi:MAG: hypothetical protein OXJ56_10415 [Rhodospirillaceae bacterium]|nr:hypothetical protein [Rhodospirillaceae bacterium]